MSATLKQPIGIREDGSPALPPPKEPTPEWKKKEVKQQPPEIPEPIQDALPRSAKPTIKPFNTKPMDSKIPTPIAEWADDDYHYGVNFEDLYEQDQDFLLGRGERKHEEYAYEPSLGSPPMELFGLPTRHSHKDAMCTLLDRLVARYYDPRDPLWRAAWVMCSFMRLTRLISPRHRNRHLNTRFIFDAEQTFKGEQRKIRVQLPLQPEAVKIIKEFQAGNMEMWEGDGRYGPRYWPKKQQPEQSAAEPSQESHQSVSLSELTELTDGTDVSDES